MQSTFHFAADIVPLMSFPTALTLWNNAFKADSLGCLFCRFGIYFKFCQRINPLEKLCFFRLYTVVLTSLSSQIITEWFLRWWMRKTRAETGWQSKLLLVIGPVEILRLPNSSAAVKKGLWFLVSFSGRRWISLHRTKARWVGGDREKLEIHLLLVDSFTTRFHTYFINAD